VSAIAECCVVPRAALGKIRDSAIPKKRLMGRPRDVFFDVLRSSSTRRFEYGWSGFVFATLLPFLDEEGVNLMTSTEDDLAGFLSEKRDATFFIVTEEHRRFLNALDPSLYDESILQAYYEAFTETQADGLGRAMLDGIEMLRESVSLTDADSVGILFIG
jgi:hypothetical protein